MNGIATKYGSRLRGTLLVFVMLLTMLISVSLLNPSNVIAQQQACEPPRETFLGIPTWYRNLVNSSTCEVDLNRDDILDSNNKTNAVAVIIGNLTSALIYVAGIIAVVFVVVGAFRFVFSDGNPQKAADARRTIYNALIGAAIAGLAFAIVETINSRLNP